MCQKEQISSWQNNMLSQIDRPHLDKKAWILEMSIKIWLELQKNLISQRVFWYKTQVLMRLPLQIPLL